MSHSSFKLIGNDEPMSQNLIIVVNKNGSVGTDTATLQNLLTSKETPMTGVTVLRETSPTPSISNEIEDERMEQIDVLKQQYRAEHPNADEDELEEHLRKISDNSVPHVTLSVENYFPPDQARKFANDVLHLGGIDNPQTLMPIDFNFRRKIVQNDHCYTPLTMSPERNEKTANAKRKDPSSLVKAARKEVKQKVRQSTTTTTVEDSGDSGDDSDEEIDEEQSAEDQSAEDISFSESDDDNDMDFSVNDRFGKKGTKKKRKYRRQKQKNLSFKDFMLEGGGGSAAADLSSLDDEPKKKYGKVVSKKTSHSSRSSASGSKIVNTPSKGTIQQTVAKKVQSANEKSLKINTPQSKFVPSSTFKAATTTASGNISQISIQSAAPTKTIQEREIVESIAKDLEKSFPESNASTSRIITATPLKKAESIPNIMQIMEQNTSAEVLDQSLSTLEHIDASDGGASIEEIGDALIAVLGNEAIDELLNQNDLMNFEPSSTALIVKPIQVQQVPLLVDTISLSPTTSPLTFSLSSPQHHQLPKILNKQAPQKDPIKIVKNGRVITLPVIEAPATRGAKRRAQGEPLTPIISTPPTAKAIRAEKTPSNKDPDSRNSSRRSSLNKSESRRQSVATQGAIEADDEGNSDASWNSEDDPDRLWCICKQPHNNRFMICCDKCEDWFHGTCVNVTKAQGKVMEENKKKWLCPNCKTIGVGVSATKKDPNKKTLNQQKLTKFFSKHQNESADDEDMPSANMCVVCGKNSSRIDSIYCSDECIQNHAIKHTSDDTSVTSPKPSITTPPQQPHPQKPEVKRGNILKNQEGNVIVYEKTTEKLLSSKLWPHISVLPQWLAQNPNCEPVRPGTNKANILMSSISSKKQLSSALQTPTISSTTPPVVKSQTVDELFSNPVKINTGNAQTTTPVASVVASNKKLNRSESIKSPTTHSPSSHGKNVKSNNSTPSVLPTVTRRFDDKKLKRQTSDEKPLTPTVKNFKAKVELERESVRNNFKTTIETRMKDFDHPSISQMTGEEIEKFAKQLELEMFLFFNKDTKDKYKNKFRSLKFNLSDVKNKSLIEKICAKRLTPKQIVTLSASDLASEELAKWREDENKHQLEIITKSELDALTQNKIVVKTHKGEEIIETNPTPIEILMPGIDDIETAISSKMAVDDDSHGRHDSTKSPLSSPSISSSTSRAKRSRSRSKSRGHDHHHSHHHKSSSNSKHKKRSRSKSRSREHHEHHNSGSVRSHGSSREKSRDESRNRSKDEKHHRERNNDTDNKNSSTKTKESKSHHHSHHHHHHHHHDKDKDKEKIKEQPQEKKYREIEPQQEDVDLVGKILDSMGVHLDMQPKKPSDELSVVAVAAVEETKKKDKTSPDDPIDTVGLIEKKVAVDPVNEHILEIEIYSGSMYMADIAKFDVTGSIVSGNVDDVMKKFPSTMEIVGRIEPKTVWDYLGKVKKLPGKELVVLRFSSTNESAYFTLFSYLHTRQRYGVIKSSSPTIKDFYLITVEANRPLPPVLLPIDGPGFIEGEEHKPDLLIGVILKIIPETKHVKKQQMKEAVKKSNKPFRPPIEHNVPIEVLPTRHKSHHHHHHSGSKLVMGLPEINDNLKQSSPSPSDDEPYEPMDEDDNVQLRATTSSTSISSKLNSSDDYLESQMEQINKEIEQRQMEIQKLAQQKAMELDEAQASRIYEKISVPHNLSEILSTINASSESKPIEIDDDDDLEYVPTATTSSMHSSAEYRASSSYPVINPPIVNSMMDIDERINLFRAKEMSPQQSSHQSGSRLASMSDADLMKLVPDNAFEMSLPPPPSSVNSGSNNEPAIPGLEYSSMET